MIVKYLVVVPDGNPVFPIWSIEYALDLASEGNEVHFLNLQELNAFIFRRKIKKAIFALSRKNRASDILSKLCKENGIFEHKVIFPKHSSFNNSLTSENEKTFKLAMSSKYGANFGSRYVSLDEIPIQTVKVERMFYSFAYRKVQELLKSLEIERLITVNGRLVVSAAVVAAARNLDIPVKLLESVDLTGSRYHIFDRSPHDLREMSVAQNKLWSSAGEFREMESQSYLESRYGERLLAQSSNEYDFSRKFDLRSHHQKIASFFPTTETEFPVFSDFYTTSTFDASQQKAFKAFAKIAKDFGFDVIVRAHPQNSDFQNVEKNEDEIWRRLCSETSSDFISASSRINSYDLINKSYLCVTYCSSIGIEAVLMGKPLLVLGESDYSDYMPNNQGFTAEEIKKILETEVPIIPVSNLYPWALWQLKGGTELRQFKVDPGWRLIFDGKKVDQARIWYQVVRNTARILRIIN